MPKIYKAPFYTEGQIETLSEAQMHFPFSDKNMEYDGLSRQYLPTEALLIEKGMGQYLPDDPTEKDNIRRHISDQIYTYMSKHNLSNIESLKYLVARAYKFGMSPFRYRLLFQDILWKQAQYFFLNGDLESTPGVDLGTASVIQKSAMRLQDRNIFPKCITYLRDLGLSYSGAYDTWLRFNILQKDW